MTTKYISTTYTAGYTLAPAYSALDIEAQGRIVGGLTLTGANAVSVVNAGTVVGSYARDSVGGIGFTMAGIATLSGAGRIFGGAGGNLKAGGLGAYLAAGASLATTGVIGGGAGGFGGLGGAGIALAAGAALTTAGYMGGGAGGYSQNGAAGAGGAGAILAAETSLTIMTAGRVYGGRGGSSLAYGVDAGGVGGVGVYIGVDLSLVAAGRIYGGYGGGDNASVGVGDGGGGGIGVRLASGASLTMTGAAIKGARGGSSLNGLAGAGGAGVAAASASSLTMTGGSIAGGAGGASQSGTAGAGGAGVDLASGAIMAMASGYVHGGAGGYSNGAFGGAGGAGVYLATEASLTTAGTIFGGSGGGAATAVSDAGGTGVVVAPGASLTTTGTIVGGAGAGGRLYAGGAGGIGVYLVSGASLTMTAGVIRGGYGGGNGFHAAGASGGAGGVGVALTSGSAATFTGGKIVGGYGGGSAYALCGAGGAGVSIAAGASLTTAVTIGGGKGGSGGRASRGGAGGAGVIMTSSTLINGGAVTGGYGGQGSSGFAGGEGGVGAALTSSSLSNGGAIAGGRGGSGGSGAVGGPGGAGVVMSYSILSNSGSILGGFSGRGGTGYSRGAGVSMTNSTLSNSGTISGGYSVLMYGYNGRLIVESGADFIGAVRGGFGTLELASGSGTITGLGDFSSAFGTLSGAAAMTFHGFGSYAIDAGTSWTLAGTDILAFQTLANAGTLAGTLGIGAAQDRVILETGGVFGAALSGDSSTLELAGATGTITGFGATGVVSGAEAMTFSGFGAYDFDAGVSWTLVGAGPLAAGKTLANAGTLSGSFALGAASSRLILETGGAFASPVNGGGGIIELAAATGTIKGIGSTGLVSGAESMKFSGFGSYDFDAGASWMLAGTDVLAAGQTLANAGTLTGTLGLGAASARVILESGGVFAGLVKGGGGTLEFAGAAGTITGLGATGAVSGPEAMTFSGFDVYDVDTGTYWTLSGANTLAAGQTFAAAGNLSNSGDLTVAGVLDVTGALTNSGTIQGTGVTVQLTAPAARLIAEAGSTWLGSIEGGAGTLELAGGVGTITGLGATGTVSGAEAMTFSGFGSCVLDAGSSWTLTGENSLAVLTDAGTLTNAGAVVGTVNLTGAVARLIVGTGSSATGPVNGGRGTLELAAGSGTITGLGATGTLSGSEAMTFSGFGFYTIDTGTSWTLAGTDLLKSGQTLANAGTLTGTLGIGAAPDRLVLESGGVFSGFVNGGHGTLELAATAGTITRLGATGVVSGAEAMTFHGFGTYDFDAGTSWTLTGKNTSSSTLVNAGSLTVANGASLTIQGGVANSGVISLRGKSRETTLTIGASGATLTGGGSLVLGTGAFDTITGATATATLTNLDDTISGAGQIGDTEMQLVNQAGGVIVQTGNVAMTIDTGTRNIVNAGTIEATGAGGLTIVGLVNNTGVLEADKGALTLNGPVTGTGTAVIIAATLNAGSVFTQNVAFGTTGELELADATTYRGAITGFSTSGKTSLDLRDIGFVGSSEATFSGTTAGGVLTVTDGTNTARITLVGNYTRSSFTASSDGAGGTIVTDPKAPSASPQAFVAAMAGLGASVGELVHVAGGVTVRETMLSGPRVAMA